MVTAPWMTSFLCRGSLGLTQLSPCPFPVHRTPEGAKKPRVTLVPSLQLLEKERSCRHAVSISLARALSQHCSSCRAAQASLFPFCHCCSLAQWRLFSTRSLERLVEGQAEGRMAAFPLWLCRGAGMGEQ